jgi:hypothetical protein
VGRAFPNPRGSRIPKPTWVGHSKTHVGRAFRKPRGSGIPKPHVAQAFPNPRGSRIPKPTWVTHSQTHVGRAFRNPHGSRIPKATWVTHSETHVGQAFRNPRGPSFHADETHVAWAFAFGTPTGPRMAANTARSMWWQRGFEVYETCELVNGKRTIPPAPTWVATAAARALRSRSPNLHVHGVDEADPRGVSVAAKLQLRRQQPGSAGMAATHMARQSTARSAAVIGSSRKAIPPASLFLRRPDRVWRAAKHDEVDVVAQTLRKLTKPGLWSTESGRRRAFPRPRGLRRRRRELDALGARSVHAR